MKSVREQIPVNASRQLTRIDSIFLREKIVWLFCSLNSFKNAEFDKQNFTHVIAATAVVNVTEKNCKQSNFL